MRKREQKLIHDPINPDSPTHQLHARIVGVAEDKMIPVKPRQELTADAARERRHVVDVGLLHHGGHGALDAAVLELEAGVLVPDGFMVEVGPAEEGLEEDESAGVCCSSQSRIVWG